MAHDNSIVSYALYLITYSALEGKVLHLEDLFVHSEHRGMIIVSYSLPAIFALSSRSRIRDYNDERVCTGVCDGYGSVQVCCASCRLH